MRSLDRSHREASYIFTLLLMLGAVCVRAQSIPSIAGTWDGTYKCAQGSTGLHLTVDAISASGAVTAVFGFFSLPPGSNVFSGSFTMQGTFDPTSGRAVFQPSGWLSQPDGFVSVGLDGTLECANMRFRGSVTGGFLCSSFDLYRRGADRCDPSGLLS